MTATLREQLDASLAELATHEQRRDRQRAAKAAAMRRYRAGVKAKRQARDRNEPT